MVVMKYTDNILGFVNSFIPSLGSTKANRFCSIESSQETKCYSI